MPARWTALLTALVAGGVMAGTVTACGSSSHRALTAAEPAVAPTSGSTPTGSVVPVGVSPEGIVFDPVTDIVAVVVHRPNRLLLLGATTLAVKQSVALPGTARHLQLAAPGGPVLVADETSDQLVEVSLAGGASTAVAVGQEPHDAAAVDGAVVVGNEYGGSISFVQQGAVVGTVADLKQPGGVIGDGATVAVVDVGAFTLSTYDVASRARLARVSAGRGPTHGVLAPGQRVVVTDTRGNAVLVYTVNPLRQVAKLALPGSPYGMAMDASTDTVWITLTGRNEVVGLDLHGTTPKEIARYATIRQPNTVTVAPGSHTLWVAGTVAGAVQRISR
jgi:DNA-binding beta-propeller fold protein YncE